MLCVPIEIEPNSQHILCLEIEAPVLFTIVAPTPP
uniref:Uncharacterized protein n=1 Tax=Utricularia reniformis TaxID=192314 RepID=A0A1Y0B304_9LAMI|nr:hypothetical protein AEK19_MT1596 [Utricularia reniformis]ART31778.1 hypothetical protein AEK19_MT1596 [Utricularia reniformis]